MTNEHLRTSKGNNDECYTYEYGVTPLLKFLPKFKDKIIWCPFDTNNSEFCKVFRRNGYKVVNSHIDYGQDFYSYEPENWDILISNPPFTNKSEVFKRAISFNKPFALLMNITYLNDGAPYGVFKDIDLQLLLFNKRMCFRQNDIKRCTNKINFMSSYFCRDFLPKQIIWSDFTNNIKLF